MKYTLSVVSIFKNESHIRQEWIEHYLTEGVEHFYLIDNGSSDQYQIVLEPYLREGSRSEPDRTPLVEVQIDPRPHLQ